MSKKIIVGYNEKFSPIYSVELKEEFNTSMEKIKTLLYHIDLYRFIKSCYRVDTERKNKYNIYDNIEMRSYNEPIRYHLNSFRKLITDNDIDKAKSLHFLLDIVLFKLNTKMPIKVLLSVYNSDSSQSEIYNYLSWYLMNDYKDKREFGYERIIVDEIDKSFLDVIQPNCQLDYDLTNYIISVVNNILSVETPIDKIMNIVYKDIKDILLNESLYVEVSKRKLINEIYELNKEDIDRLILQSICEIFTKIDRSILRNVRETVIKKVFNIIIYNMRYDSRITIIKADDGDMIIQKYI